MCETVWNASPSSEVHDLNRLYVQYVIHQIYIFI